MKIRSSYLKNNYKSMFQALIGITNPTVCVELGVLDGFSTVVIGSILKSLKEGGQDIFV